MSEARHAIQTHVFSNGLTLVYEPPSNKLPITSINAFCRFGSAYEPEEQKGSAHFIEHMCFKGTKKIPKSRDIFLEYDKVGARFNAYTNTQLTCYTVKCEDDFLENCIQIVSDMMLNSVFKKSEMTKEHQVVIEENIRDSDDSEDIVSNMMNRHIYKGSSYEYPVDDIKYHKKGALEHDELVKIYKKYYRPNNIILSIVSHVSFAQILKVIELSYFLKGVDKKQIPNCMSSPMPVLNLAYTPQTQIQYELLKRMGKNTLHLMIGFRTCSHFSTDKYCLNILKNVLGGALSSRLFMILREENGLTYTSSASTTYYEHLGDFSIYAETDYKKIMKNGTKSKGVLPLIIDLLHDLIKHGIKQSELTETKSNLKGKMMLNREDIDTQTSHNGYEYLLFGANRSVSRGDKIIPYRDVYDTFYKNITMQQINDVIRKYFKPENMTVCIVGSHIPSLKTIQDECKRM